SFLCLRGCAAANCRNPAQLFPGEQEMMFSRSSLAAALCLAASSALAGPATRPMSELKIAATIPIGKTADWVAVTSDEGWIGSTGPEAVSEIDPHTNRTTRVLLPGEPCAGLAVDADSLWVPLCGT